jgi:hypothetical protein
MSEQQTAVLTKQKVQLAPFEIEISTHNSGDAGYIFIPGTLRGRWSRNKLGSLSASVSREMASMPDVPGMRVRVIPKENKYVVYDPLESQPELLKQIGAILRNALVFSGDVTYVKRVERKLDDDTFVSLLLELRRVYDGKNPTFEVISGELPTEEQINALPGRELNNPFCPYSQPKYKGDEDRHAVLLRAMAEKGIII